VFAVFQFLFVVRKAPTDFCNLQSFFQSVLPKFLLFTHTLIFNFQIHFDFKFILPTIFSITDFQL